ncbi:unnamed protein product [Prorocentrum cordatum]|uniref:Uncharacterized protein n=1 Tax=Prorocentrum cordatum TaxID=2364126 RepID=A0ABN9TKB3_9DINO|nr:unnamed protein product [Polarella glacialis]
MDAMQEQVDDVWRQTSFYLEHFFRSAMRKTMDDTGEEAESIRGWSVRKNTKTFRCQKHQFGECDDPRTSAHIQQLDNLRGRMRHMQWLRRKGREDGAEGRKLEEKIREGLTKHGLVTLKEVEVKLEELRKQRRQGRMDRLRGSAPGADGWHGDELASLYCPAVVSHLADVFNFMLDQGCVPTEWRKARQVMLPKEGTGRRKRDGSNAVQALRPITILSCWWRLLGSALLRSPDAQAWQKKWWREEAVGGRKAGEVDMPLMNLSDPWSMIAMVAVRSLPIMAIVARFPASELTCFVDDRSWTPSTAQELLAVGEAAAGRQQLPGAGAPHTTVTVMLERSAHLPACVRMKEATMAGRALAVAEYGCIDRQTNKKDETQLRAAIVRARKDALVGSMPSCKAAAGRNVPGGSGEAPARFSACAEAAPAGRSAEDAPSTCSRWREQNRVDSFLCRFEQYDERRCRAARLLAEGSTHAASVMSGAFVSPAHLQAPDFEHVVWR